MKIMHELPRITIFGLRARRFVNTNTFHERRSHVWKLLANRITSNPKTVIQGNECPILFLTRNFMSLKAKFIPLKQLSIADFALSLRPFFSELAL